MSNYAKTLLRMLKKVRYTPCAAQRRVAEEQIRVRAANIIAGTY